MSKIIKLFIPKSMTKTVGNLALKTNTYEKPEVKKLVKVKPSKKLFMGCWQGCNEDSDGDGC